MEGASKRVREMVGCCGDYDSPGVVPAVGLDEVQVSVFGQEGHQLVIGPKMEENYLLFTGKHMVTVHAEDNYANESTCSCLL